MLKRGACLWKFVLFLHDETFFADNEERAGLSRLGRGGCDPDFRGRLRGPSVVRRCGHWTYFGGPGLSGGHPAATQLAGRPS